MAGVQFCFLGLVLLVTCQISFSQNVSIGVRTSNDDVEFHVGEEIPIDLVYVASLPNTYEVNTSVGYPERIPMPDLFLVEPHNGWADPLGGYREAMSKALNFVGVLVGNSPIGPKPFTLRLILNDYISFSRPGHYTLQVQDSRVFPVAVKSGVRIGRAQSVSSLLLTSNQLELTILPAGAEWQQDQLQAATDSFAQLQQAIDSHARSYKANVRDSCIILRSLGTPAAADIMVDATRDEELFSTCSFQTGVLQYPDKKLILKKMRKRFNDPNFPVSYTFINTMAMISIMANGHPDQAFTIADREKADRELEQQLSALLSAKQGKAKAVAINTLISMWSFKKPSRLKSKVLQVATANFEQLSPHNKRILTDYLTAHGMTSPGR